MGHCKDCKFWDRNHECDAVQHSEDGRTWPPGVPLTDKMLVDVSVADDHGLDVRVETGPEFGCVLFRPKQEEES